MRMGIEAAGDSFNRLAKKLDFDNNHGIYETNVPQRKKFSRHSGRRSGICETEKKIGGLLSDREKLALTGHKTIEMYEWYANRGEYTKIRAAEKRQQLMNDARYHPYKENQNPSIQQQEIPQVGFPIDFEFDPFVGDLPDVGDLPPDL